MRLLFKSKSSKEINFVKFILISFSDFNNSLDGSWLTASFLIA